MRRGEVWRVRLPPDSGHVQAGVRPAVIVLHDVFHGPLPTTLIVPFTSQTATLRYPGTHLVQPSTSNGLTSPSVAMAFQMRVLDQRSCLARLGELDSIDLDLIIAAIDLLTH
jgi:mRNA-degrading endonuclease toxin of MazEF toxin-antitoxin module